MCVAHWDPQDGGGEGGGEGTGGGWLFAGAACVMYVGGVGVVSAVPEPASKPGLFDLMLINCNAE